MKMIIAIVQNEDSQKLISALTKADFSVTRLATTGGFLRVGNTTMMLGVQDDQVEKAMHVIEGVCKSRKQIMPGPSPMAGHMDSYLPIPVEVTVGGATVFVLNVDQFHKI